MAIAGSSTTTRTATAAAGGTGLTATFAETVLLAPPAPSTALTLVDGGGQSAVLGTPFARPVTVLAVDGQAQPIVGATVTFAGTGLSFTRSTATTGSDGKASVAVTPTAVGTSTGTATVNGVPVTFTETGLPAAAQVTLSTPGTAVAGQPLTLKATVSGALGTPTGIIAFLDNGTMLGTAAIFGGVATFQASPLEVGGHTLTALYPGDDTYGPGWSPDGALTVSKAPTTITLAQPGPVAAGEKATLTATVGSANVTPGASVVFLAGATPLGAARLAPGATPGTYVATLAISTLPVGLNGLTAQYPGDASTAPSVSALVELEVDGVAVLQAPPAEISVGSGDGTSFPFALALEGLHGVPLTFTATGLPPGAECQFSDPTVVANDGTVTERVTITTTPPRPDPGSGTLPIEHLGVGMLTLFGICAMPGFGRNRWRGRFLGILALALLGQAMLPGRAARGVVWGGWAGYLLMGFGLSHHISTHSYYHLPLIPLAGLGVAALVGAALRSLPEPRRVFGALAALVLLATGLMSAWEARTVLKRADYRDQPAFWQGLAEKMGQKASVAGITQDYGYRLEYWGWITPNNWLTSAEFALRKSVGQTFDLPAIFKEKTANKEFFLVTMLDELDLQPELKAMLNKDYPVFARGPGYIIYYLLPENK